MHSLTRPTLAVAGLGGALWTIKALTITANDGSFAPLEGIFFLGGLAALVVAAVLVAADLTRRLDGPRRLATAAATAVGLVVLTVLLESVGKEAVAAIASGDNVGWEDEGGILLAGLAWLAAGLQGLRGGQLLPSTSRT